MNDELAKESGEEKEKKNPKEVLLAELKRLADIFGKYSLNDR